MGVQHYSFPVPKAPRSSTANKSRAGTILEVSKNAGWIPGTNLEDYHKASRWRSNRQWNRQRILDSYHLCAVREELVSLGCVPEICVTDLVPDEDRGWDSDDLTAQVHLGTSDIPDVLGGCHNRRTYKRGHKIKHVF